MSFSKPEYKEPRTPALSIKKITLLAAFIALSAVGAMIKIPSPVGTIGLDSAPGYLAALALGGYEGALVIALGHLLTSMVVGFPLTIPIHLLVAFQMALWALSFRWIHFKLGTVAACVAIVLLNGVLSSFTMVLVGGWAAAIGVMPFLAAGSALNAVVAAAAYQSVKKMKIL